MRCAVSFLMVIAAVNAPAWGGVIFDNGAPSGFTFTLTPSVQAEDFTLAQPSTVTGLRFYALERLNGYAGSIYWSIRGDDSARPSAIEIAGDTTSAVTRTLTGFIDPNHKNAAEGIYGIDIDPLALGPGDYWLILHNGPLSHDVPDGSPGFLLWEGNRGPAGAVGVEDPTPFDAAWQQSVGERSFQLVGVPEPGTALPVGGMLIVSLLRARTNGQKQTGQLRLCLGP